ncbi:putative inorganic diphosphatase [Helianthus debilis subsp. tardiflorus]
MGFDRTIITKDCDRSVVLGTDLTKLFHRVRVSLDWNQVIVSVFVKLGFPFKDNYGDVIMMLRLFVYVFRCEMKVLSNANQFFIETILKNDGVFVCVSGIISN